MNELSQTQQKIMDYLLNNPEGASIDDLVESLSLTKTAIREHLVKLQNFGYIEYVNSTAGVGRPKHLFFLSSTGKEVFPRQYSWLAISLLEKIVDLMGAHGAKKMMKDLADQVASTIKISQFDKSSTQALLQKISTILNSLGYRSRVKQSDLRKGAVIEASNCVYHSVAVENPELCHFDIRLLENLSGLNVRLDKCIAKGDTVCRFCLKRK